MISIDSFRVLWHPKGVAGGYYEDAAAFDLQGRRFAIADGVSSAIFSDVWAKVLVDTAVEGDIPLDDMEAMVEWLTPLRDQWKESLPTTMSDFQLQRLQETRGGHSTLLGVNVIDNEGEIYFESYSIGDCCMFVFRDGKLHASFPGEDAAFFGINPTSLPSSRIPRERYQADRYRGTLEVGDSVVLASDAVACWMFKEIEAGNDVDLQFFEKIESLDWSEWVRDSRIDKHMRVDDVTLMMFRIGDSSKDNEPVEIQAVAVQESEVKQPTVTTVSEPAEEPAIDAPLVVVATASGVSEVTADLEPVTLTEPSDEESIDFTTSSSVQPIHKKRSKIGKCWIIAGGIVAIIAIIVLVLVSEKYLS
jgi:hypothetical protein